MTPRAFTPKPALIGLEVAALRSYSLIS